jgi:hypothetical protein
MENVENVEKSAKIQKLINKQKRSKTSINNEENKLFLENFEKI